MSKGKFAFSLADAVVTRGSKVSGFAQPTLYTSPVKDKFCIDSKGKDLLEIEAEGRILLIDKGSKENTIKAFEGIELTNPSRFMIAPGYMSQDEGGNDTIARGSKIGKNAVFNYTKIWGAMILNEDGTKQISVRELVDKGLAVKGITETSKKTTYGATKKIFYRIEPLTYINEDGEEEQVIASLYPTDEVEVPIFSLIEFARDDIKAEELAEELKDDTEDNE